MDKSCTIFRKCLIVLLLLTMSAHAAMSQKVVTTIGGDLRSNTGSVAFTIGEPAAIILSPTRTTNEGVQQPYREDSSIVDDYVCQYMTYTDNGFNVSASLTAEVGTFTFRDTLFNVNMYGGDSIRVLHLTVHPAVQLQLQSSTNVLCNGLSTGSITVSSTGGTADFAYSLNGGESQASPTFTHLAAGNYSVSVVDQYGCVDTLPVEITQPDAALAVSYVGDPLSICRGGNTSITDMSVSGGTSPYTYQWKASSFASSGMPAVLTTSSISVNPISTTEYKLVVTDNNGCSDSATTTVTVKDVFLATYFWTACDSYDWYEHNNLTVSTTAFQDDPLTHTFTAVNGCDSVVTLDLTVNYSNAGYDVKTACDSYSWIDGETYTESNDGSVSPITFTIDGGNVYGCDSVVTLILTINHSSSGDDEQDVCDSLRWTDGNLYTTTSTDGSISRVISGGNSVGCDSTAHLLITVRQSTQHTDNQSPCDSLVWLDGNKYTADNNTATYHTTNVANCDSLITLNLTLRYHANGIDYQTPCDSLIWINGIKYTTNNNTALDTVVAGAVNGCDSVVTLNLTLRHRSTGNDVKHACDSYTWINNVTYTTSNNSDLDTLTNGNLEGCDSIITLNLTLDTTTHYTDIHDVCDTYTWIDDNIYTSSNSTAVKIYYNGNAHACDSVVTLNLTVRHRSVGNDEQNVCDSLRWIDGNLYTATNTTGTLTYTLANGNAENCDSTVTLLLTVRESSEGIDAQNVCDSLEWYDGVTYYANNTTATHVIPNGNIVGCDSLIMLNLEVRYSNEGVDDQTACDQFVWFNDAVYTESNTTDTYRLSGANAEGCDSVVTLNLTINNSNSGIDEIDACESYMWIDGNNYTESNNTATYTLDGQNQSGCDSVVTLNLSIHHATTGDTTATSCIFFDWYEHQNITESTSPMQENPITHTFQTIYGCDSVVTLNLTITTETHADTIASACETFDWYEHTNIAYSTSHLDENPITHTLEGADIHGCDSVVTLILTINHASLADTTATACDSFSWYEHTGITQSTDQLNHTFEAADVNGCDSIVTLLLAVNHSNSRDTVVDACDQFGWYGNTYSESGSYEHHTTNVAGCDSTIVLHLTIHQVQHTTDYDTICASMLPYQWNNVLFEGAGFKNDTLHTLSEFPCDSIVTRRLTVHNSYSVRDSRIVCADALPYIWNGVTFEGDSTESATLLTIDNCDSTVVMTVAVEQQTFRAFHETACYSYQWHDQQFTELGLDTALHTVISANNCVNTDTLYLTLYGNSGTTLTAEGCDFFTWQRTQQTFSSDTTVTYSYHDAHGCISTDTLFLSIFATSYNAYTAHACDTFVWQPNGEYGHGDSTVHTESIVKVNTYINDDGCPSFDTLHLDMYYGTYRSFEAEDCNAFVWDSEGDLGYGTDSTYVLPGTYLGRYVNSNECPSVDTLHLSLRYGDHLVEAIHSCDSFVWVHRDDTIGTFFSDGYYTADYYAENGCASTDTLHLTLGHANSSVDRHVVCDTLEWHGTIYKEKTETPTYLTTNISGCDSTVRLSLMIYYATTVTEIVNACDSYVWHDTLYTQTTIDTFRSINFAGCDSLVFLALYINHGVETVDSVVACDSVMWHNRLYYESTNRPQAHLIAANGCDSVVNLHLIVKHSSSSTQRAQGYESFTYNQKRYIYSGTYRDTIYNNVGCDSVVTLTLAIIHNRPIPVIQAYGNFSVNVNHYPNGTDAEYVDYIAYRWYRNGTLIPSAREDVYHAAGYAPLYGSFYVEVPTDESREYWVHSNSIDLVEENTKQINVDAIDFHTNLYPNPVRRGGRVLVNLVAAESDIIKGSRLEVYDLHGRLMYSAEANDISHTFVASFATGVYSVVYRVPHRDNQVVKLIVK